MSFKAASVAVLLALALDAPAAAQINLSWDDCGLAGQQLKGWSCDSNPDVVARIYVSFIVTPELGLTSLTGAETDIRIWSAGDVLPSWWQLGTSTAGSCRPTGIGFEFTTPCASALDYWATVPGGVLGGGGLFYAPGYPGVPLGGARLTVVQAVDGSRAGAPAPGEHYLCSIAIKGANTTGVGACGGCGTPVGLLLNSVRLTQPIGVGDVFLSYSSDRQWIAWQCGSWGEYGFGFYNCPTPARPTTWGQVKALYR